MDINRQIDEMRTKFKNSPIRERIRNGSEFPLQFDGEKKNKILELYDELLIQEDKLLKPLNVVLMGEVKSGKSTLLNALVGDKVSPTKVLEATAVVLEVGFGRQEKAVIHYKDGNKHEGSIEKIFGLLMENQTSNQFANTVDKVRVTKDKEGYKYFNLVDTPGLLTITSRNIDTTKNYLKWADVILWLLDANYLGQSDIIKEIEEVEEYGKPIIGILNKIDGIGDDLQKVIDYANYEYELYFEKIIPLSAQQAFDAIITKDENLKKKSGFMELIQYLEDNISDSSQLSEEVKLDSMKRTLDSIGNRDNYYHIEMLNEVNEIIETYYDIEEHMNYYCNRISKKIEDTVKSKVRNEFLKEEVDYVIRTIDSASTSSSQLKELEYIVQGLGSEHNIRSYIGVLQEQIDKVLSTEWSAAMQILENRIKDKLSKFIEKEKRLREELGEDLDYSQTQVTVQSQYNALLGENKSIMGVDTEALKEGLIISGGAGAAVAVYAAVLGPAAASVTLGAALATLIPPIAIGGIVIVGLRSLLGKNKQKKELKSAVINAVEMARARFNDEVVDRYIMPKTMEDNEGFKNKALNTYIKMVFNNYDIAEVRRLEEELKSYIT